MLIVGKTPSFSDYVLGFLEESELESVLALVHKGLDKLSMDEPDQASIV